MAIPLSTTTVTIRAADPQSDVDPDSEGYDAPLPELEVLATGVRATITLPKPIRSVPTDQIDRYQLRLDTFDGELTRHCVVTDEATGQNYSVDVAAKSLPEQYGLEHWVATLTIHKGVTSGGDFNAVTRV